MSVRAFLNAAFAALVEAYQQGGGKDLLTAVDDVHRVLGLPIADSENGAGAVSDNQRALNELEQAMKGLGR